MTERLIRLPEVERLVGLRRSAIYSWIKRGTFPAPIRLGTRSSAWNSDQIEAWISDRLRAGCDRGVNAVTAQVIPRPDVD